MSDEDMRRDEDLFEAAARWTLRLRESQDAALRAEHAAWLEAGPGRVQAMAEAEAVLQAMTAAFAPEAIAPSPRRARPVVRVSARKAWSLPAAAAACLVLALGGGVVLRDAVLSDPNRLAAKVGEVRRHVLADGSQVTLNTGAVLEVAYGPERRGVRLIKGEAFFDVVHDPARPFVVESRAGSARVLGTAFDVRLKGDAARVSVLRGAVQVAPARGGDATVLRAGQGGWLDGATPRPVALEDPAAIDAWRRGRLVIYHRPLSEVAEEIGRYRRGLVLVAGDALSRKPVSGVFDVARPDAGLDALAASLNLRTARLGPVVLLY